VITPLPSSRDAATGQHLCRPTAPSAPGSPPSALAVLAVLALLAAGCGHGAPQPTTITLTYSKGAPIASKLLLGAAIDGHERGDNARIFTPANLRAMASAGLGALSYRLRTELGSEAWHWSRGGTWSDPRRRQGYWVGNGHGAGAITNGYRLPRRGDTFDQAENSDYSRIDDGDPSTFWKSNPYLDRTFTHEPNSRHPQWLLVDLGREQPVDSLRVTWGPVRPRAFAVQSWPHGSPLFQIDTPARVTVDWRPLATGRVSDREGTAALDGRKVRYLRLLFSGSRHLGPPTPDVRDRVGVSVDELHVLGGARDLIRHAKGNGESAGSGHDRAASQTVIYTSSTDPWHRASDRDPNYEQPSLLGLARGPLNRRPARPARPARPSPMLVPSPLYYDTPANARAWLEYLKRTRVPIRGIELGEEPDGQLVAPEDYAALYVQVAREARAVDPAWRTGGPSLQKAYPDWVFWLDAHHDPSWMHRLLGYLRARGASSLFDFFSFEWYPFDDTCDDPLGNLRAEPAMLGTVVRNQRRAGVPTSIPWIVAEYGYSAYSGAPEVDLAGAILDAEVVGQMSRLVPHPEAHFYGYEPVPLISESDRCDTWGNLTLFVTDGDDRIRYRVPAYWAIDLLSRHWADSQPAYPLASTQSAELTTYPLLHRDGSVSVLLLNKGRSARAVTLDVVDGGRTARLSDLRAWQYSAANYRFLTAGENGHPVLDRPPTGFSARREITLPPLSFTVVRARL
jgi:hypothetical protein